MKIKLIVWKSGGLDGWVGREYMGRVSGFTDNGKQYYSGVFLTGGGHFSSGMCKTIREAQEWVERQYMSWVKKWLRKYTTK